MAQEELTLPKMGESVAEATIIRWLKEEGEQVEEDESIVEIATDKVDSEVPSPFEGVLIKQNFAEGEVAKVGDVIGLISTQGETAADDEVSKTKEVQQKEELTASIEEKILEPLTTGKRLSSVENTSGRFYSPLVKSIANQEGLSYEELEGISGTGLNGRLTKKDLLTFLKKGATGAGKNSGKKSSSVSTKINNQPAISVDGGDQIIEMDRMRKLIADHMVMSKQVSPHVTSFVEADVTGLVLWRNRVKNSFFEKYGVKLTFTPILIEAVIKALKDFPMVNSSLDGNKIIVKKDINIGMATALPSGNLIVPVIKQANELNLLGLTKQVNDLAIRARENKLAPDEIQGGTYTVTNVGSFGNVMGTPIINQPQAAILALGEIRKKPAVIETPSGDTIGIRQMMFLSHAYDHRIIDGALGGSFVRKVADYLEGFDVDREI